MILLSQAHVCAWHLFLLHSFIKTNSSTQGKANYRKNKSLISNASRIVRPLVVLLCFFYLQLLVYHSCGLPTKYRSIFDKKKSWSTFFLIMIGCCLFTGATIMNHFLKCGKQRFSLRSSMVKFNCMTWWMVSTMNPK